MSKRIFSIAVALLICSIQNISVQAGNFEHSHGLYAHVLQKYVKNGWVNYRSLKSDLKDLNAYLNQMASVQESEFSKWTRSQKLAYLINLYNASTLHLIVDHYPLKSIKDIGNIFKGPWDQPVVRLFGEHVTLNHLEHNILRKKYDEPRSHFVLVCAAKGCPVLREEPYTPEKLEEQFTEQGKEFLSTEHKNSIDPVKHIVYLSPIFDWFDEDFIKKSGSVLAFVQPYFPQDKQRELLKGNFHIKYTHYDWSLNDSEKQEN